MTATLKRLLLWLGPMRVVLFVLALAAAALVPDPAAPVEYRGAGLFYSVLVPVFAPLILMVLLLDALMSRVWQAAAEGEEAARYRTLLRLDLGFGLLLVLAWLPFFLALR